MTPLLFRTMEVLETLVSEILTERFDSLRHLKVPSFIDWNPGSKPPGIFLR
jgi:hypothetical protein